MRSRGAPERRALTGEAGNASRRRVDCGSHTATQPRMGRGVADARRSGPTFSRVMRINFGVRMAEIFHEHSDSLDLKYKLYFLIVVS
jgi:hypothetical protein